MTISNYLENQLLDAVFNAEATGLPIAQVFVKLHIGDPGEDCTANAAGETTRKEMTAAAAASGATTNDNALTWTSVSTTEDYSHISCWDHLTAGNPLWSGPLTANPVTAGDTFTIPVGDLDVTLD